MFYTQSSGNETLRKRASLVPRLDRIFPAGAKMRSGNETTKAWPSLVPRPFPPPVFDRFQYKDGGEGLGERVTCVTSGRREGPRLVAPR